uniref:FecR family protein n=1 Tax=Pedobacter schmidteae TaxID=2201271 RepID=UPI000EAFA4CD|nr:FecR family protein [Pedobacter schmidteae]
MLKEQFIALATKVDEHSATDAELGLYLFYINNYGNQNPLWETLDPETREFIKIRNKQKILKRIDITAAPKVNKSRILWIWPGIAAAVILLISITGMLFYFKQKNTAADKFYVNDIAPGKSGATLTLANGKKIILSDRVNGELARESGLSIKKTADGQLIYVITDKSDLQLSPQETTNGTNTLSTANGETYRINLPDGSLVWLNAASSLSYSTALINQGKRIVNLSGEAYFEVAKDKAHPFIVRSGLQEIEVLGTHFNVNSYPEDRLMKTTLLEGSLRVSLPGKTDQPAVILAPGQQAALRNGKLNVGTVDTEMAIDWKNGYFNFNNETLDDIMNKLSRWYGVDIIYAEASLKQETFVGSINRYQKISKVLQLLQQTGIIRFNIEGKTIKISREE